MSDPRTGRALWGRIGGLRAHGLHGSPFMLAAARRGYRSRFEREAREAAARAGENLTATELEIRAERLLRSWMLELAARSAAARKKKADPVGERTGAGQEVRRGGGEPRSG